MPRFKDGALEANLELVARVKELATRKGVTPGQLALAWVHAQVGRVCWRVPQAVLHGAALCVTPALRHMGPNLALYQV